MSTQTVFFVEGYDSWGKQTVRHVADSLKQAEVYSGGLTDPKILRIQGATKLDCFNKILNMWRTS